MRKLIFLVLLAFSINANAQKIEVNRMENDGSWQIMTSGKDFSFKDKTYSFNLKAFIKDRIPTYCLLISSFNEIPKDAKILFRLDNGHVIYLPVSSVSSTDIKTSIKKKKVIIPKTQQYYTSIFPISEADYKMIEQFGIVKMRISEGVAYLEKIWNRNQLGKFMKKSRSVINKEIDKHIAKDIWDDF